MSTLILLAMTAAHADPAGTYAPDPFGWPMVYIDESYPEIGVVGGFARGELGPQGVVGGEKAAPGSWDDAVGIVFYGYYVGCTGTLIADNVVLTAGHCVGGITDVIVGSKDWTKDGGEVLEVEKTVEYPNSWSSYDIAVLKLKRKSEYPPRYIAMDCILDEYLDDGAEVAVVGFGSTNIQGDDWNTKLNEGVTVVQDADCSEQWIDGIYAGCNASVQPGGEIGAGGNGVDACFGDSGGPLYLLTPEGDFLVGVTSRAYLGVDNDTPCKDGGIYVRPDAVFKWIEASAGRDIPVYNCNHAPEVLIEPIVTHKNRSGVTYVEVVDEGASFEVEVVEEPLHGTVSVGGDGELEYTPDEGYVGEDSFVVAITDDGHPDYSRSEPITVEQTVDVAVEAGLLGGAVGMCGCDAARSPIAAGWLVGLVGILGLRRRR